MVTTTTGMYQHPVPKCAKCKHPMDLSVMDASGRWVHADPCPVGPPPREPSALTATNVFQPNSPWKQNDVHPAARAILTGIEKLNKSLPAKDQHQQATAEAVAAAVAGGHIDWNVAVQQGYGGISFPNPDETYEPGPGESRPIGSARKG